MVMLTVVRRLAIFVVFIGLIINGLCLVIANRAAAHPDTGGASLALHVHLRDKASAEALLASIKKDCADSDLRADVSSAQRQVEVSTGKYSVSLDLEEDLVSGITNALKSQGFQVVLTNGVGKRRIVSLKESFSSKGQADARARQVSEKTSNVVSMSAVETKVKKQMTVWTVNVVLPNEAAFDEMRAYVRKKQPSAELEP